jgi:hypothetical protein
VQIDGDDDEDELGEEVVDEVVLAREREAAALAASDVADEGEPVDDALEPDAADLDDLDDEVGDGVIPSRTRRTAMTPWSTGGPSTWRPGATVTVQQRTVAARPAAYTKAGVPAVERSTVVVSDFDERRAAQLADRALPEPHVAETGGRQPHDWETLPDDIAGMAVAAVFEALMDSGGLQHEGARRAALAYINNVKLPDDLIARDDIRRGFEAVRRQFDAFARTLPANDRSTVVHTAGSTSLKYLLNGQFSAAAGRISSELDQLSRHVLAYSRAKSA